MKSRMVYTACLLLSLLVTSSCAGVKTLDEVARDDNIPVFRRIHNTNISFYLPKSWKEMTVNETYGSPVIAQRQYYVDGYSNMVKNGMFPIIGITGYPSIEAAFRVLKLYEGQTSPEQFLTESGFIEIEVINFGKHPAPVKTVEFEAIVRMNPGEYRRHIKSTMYVVRDGVIEIAYHYIFPRQASRIPHYDAMIKSLSF